MRLPRGIYGVDNERDAAQARELLARQEPVDRDPYPAVELAERVRLQDLAREHDVADDVGGRDVREELREPEERGARVDVVEVGDLDAELELVQVGDRAQVEWVGRDVGDVRAWGRLIRQIELGMKGGYSHTIGGVSLRTSRDGEECSKKRDMTNISSVYLMDLPWMARERCFSEEIFMPAISGFRSHALRLKNASRDSNISRFSRHREAPKSGNKSRGPVSSTRSDTHRSTRCLRFAHLRRILIGKFST